MRLETWLAAFRAPHKRALLSLVRVLHGHARFLCLASLEDTGVLRGLVVPSTVDEVADRCGIERTDLLRALLDLGTKVGLVRRRGDRYRGALATALANDRATPVGAFLREQLHYHGAVFR